ncbi:hypothetical protein [Brevibacillus borstelensis]|uniref:hypothetical protein n=1 Tax=Brevibacillus borstelensis TaxID=45462 RepID=UPI002E23CA26|nr:hypothetical protein [Brevibacillus borstelensis]
MNDNERDYTVLTSIEKSEYDKILEKEKFGKLGDIDIKINLFREYPKAVRHFKSLFPNNYLDIVDLDNWEVINSVVDRFLTNLNNGSIEDERDIAKFVKKSKAYSL